MAQLDAKWQVPDNFDITEREFVLPPPRGHAPTQPLLCVLSVRALEDQATGDGVLALYAWQMAAGAPQIAAETLGRLAANPNLSGIELLMLGHAYAATGSNAAFEVAQRARKILKQPVNAQSVDASLLLAATALPHGAERVLTLLEKLEPELPHGNDEQRAVHALIRAAADPSPAKLDEAYTWFAAQDDNFGLAQCALVAHAHELATTKRPELLRGYLEHAIFRLESDGRPEWAALTTSHALVPLLVDELKAPATEVAAQLGVAAALAVQAKSHIAIESVFRIASKLGFSASLRTLNQFEPPTFQKQDAAAPAPPARAPRRTVPPPTASEAPPVTDIAPAAAAPVPAAESAPAAATKKPSGKKGKKRSA